MAAHTLAGTGHEGRAKIIRAHCRNGAPIRLVRERDNPYDQYAVAAYLPVPKLFGLFGDGWKKVGYIRRTRNHKVAAALDRGDDVTAEVSSYYAPPGRESPRVSIEIHY